MVKSESYITVRVQSQLHTRNTSPRMLFAILFYRRMNRCNTATQQFQYLAIIVDSTIDISRIYQFSLFLRYARVNGDAMELFTI